MNAFDLDSRRLVLPGGALATLFVAMFWPGQMQADLFVYYPIDGDSGTAGTMLADASGEGRHGSYVNSVALESDTPMHTGGTAAHFDGATNFAAGTVEQPTQALTLQAWAKSDTPTWNDSGHIISKRDAFIFHPDKGSGRMRFYVRTPSSNWTNAWVDLSTIPEFDLQHWHHFVGTYDQSTPGQEMKLYVDGALRATASLSGPIRPSTKPISMGWDEYGGVPRYFDGMIDETAVWDHALTAGEIRGLSGGTVRATELETPLVHEVLSDEPFAYYRFDHDDGTVGGSLWDSSGNGRHGQYGGTADVAIEGGTLATIGGSAAHFDAALEHFAEYDPNASDTPTGELTVELWAKSDSPLWNETGCLVSDRDSFIMHPVTGENKALHFYVRAAGESYWRSAQVDLADLPGFDIQQWHHYVGTYDPDGPSGEQIKLYVDGVLVDTGTATGALLTGGNPLWIGRDHYSGDRWFDGMIDEVVIYSTALSAERISAHFHAVVPEPGSLAMAMVACGLCLLSFRPRRRAS